jgi:6-pyruvoyltetrahydropterin/6-carboxytetrahydropterin synthase
MYQVIKTYGHDLGISCCFRQWRADSHCNKLHGYSLAFEFTFESKRLDLRNWVVDFGGLKPLKEALYQEFDHKTLVAKDDPDLSFFEKMHELNIIDLKIVEHVGCETFAFKAYSMALEVLDLNPHSNPKSNVVWLTQVKVSEHGSNSAVYQP